MSHRLYCQERVTINLFYKHTVEFYYSSVYYNNIILLYVFHFKSLMLLNLIARSWLLRMLCKKLFVESFFFQQTTWRFLVKFDVTIGSLGQQLKVNNLNCERTVRQAIVERRSSSLPAPTLRQYKVNSRLNSIIHYSQFSACEHCCMKMWEWEPPEYHATLWDVQPNVVQVTAHSLFGTSPK